MGSGGEGPSLALTHPSSCLRAVVATISRPGRFVPFSLGPMKVGDLPRPQGPCYQIIAALEKLLQQFQLKPRVLGPVLRQYVRCFAKSRFR
jgi:hypothetical protein